MSEPDGDQTPDPDGPRVEGAQDFAGIPDGFGRLWTPHRAVYMKGENKPRDASESQCPFCRATERSDAEGLIVHRGAECFVVMNLYPYSPGHVMVCPYRHVSMYPDLTPSETVEVAELTQHCMRALEKVSGPHGFNLGMNQGAIAGAGIAAHLHQHIVPRWQGDMNFMPIIGQTRTMAVLLEDARQALIEVW